MVVPARQQAEADGAVPAALAAVGLATVSTAITLAAACTYYYRLALTGIFLAGVTLVGASVWVSDNPAARRAAGKKLLHAAVPPLLATVGLMVAALLW
uniref:Uncharacterized protein n=1 Tax=Oryza glumipatula TaxID=40148 RepID=A0A0D9Y364_9ORYZ